MCLCVYMYACACVCVWGGGGGGGCTCAKTHMHKFQWQIERRTGRKITELFDWIVGTSTGGIVALGMVYGMCATVMLLRHSCCSTSIVSVYILCTCICTMDGSVPSLHRESTTCIQKYVEDTHLAYILLGLLAGKLSVSDMRKFYFRVRNDVFKDPRAGVAFDADALEEMLQSVVKKEMRMSDVTYPR